LRWIKRKEINEDMSNIKIMKIKLDKRFEMSYNGDNNRITMCNSHDRLKNVKLNNNKR